MGAGAGRHEAEGRPWGADARGQEPGSGQGGRQEAAPASGSQGLPSCAAMGDATRGETGLGELTPKQPLPQLVPGARSPAPATSPPSVAVQRRCIPRRCPGPSPGAGENAAPARQQERCAGRKRLKKKQSQEQKQVPLWLVFPTGLKQASLPLLERLAVEKEGRGSRQGLRPVSMAGRCCCCHRLSQQP